MEKLLPLTNDYVFKSNFGYKGRENVTRVLLKDIFRKEIDIVELDNNPITEKEIFDDKVGIMDIKARIGNESVCNIEMQVVKQDDIVKRILFYWSNMYFEEIKAGEDYGNAKKTIGILIADFELDNLQKIKKYITRWNLREEKYTKIILTDIIDIYIIELPKIEKYGNSEEYKNLNLWIKFIKNPEGFNMSEKQRQDKELKETVEAIEEVKENLENMSNTEHERYLAHLRQKHILDQKSILKTGIRQGREEGLQEGMKERSKAIAKKMLEKNKPIEEIMEFTELTKEEIEKL